MNTQELIADIERELNKGKKANISQADIRSLVIAYRMQALFVARLMEELKQLKAKPAEQEQT
jgi:hypothetical protein